MKTMRAPQKYRGYTETTEELFQTALSACKAGMLPEFFQENGVDEAQQSRLVQRLNEPPHSFGLSMPPPRKAKPRPQRLSAEQHVQLIFALRDPSLLYALPALPFQTDALLELSLAECISAPGALMRIAADTQFLTSFISLTALDLSCSLREVLRNIWQTTNDEAGYRSGLFTILEAMPPTLTTLTLPEGIGDFCHVSVDYGEGLGATLGKMAGTIKTLTINHAFQGSSDTVPSFVQTLNHQWLPRLPHLTSLSLVDCALHSAESALVLAEDELSLVGRTVPSRMRGDFGPQTSCQLADLAAAAPKLTDLNLSGNLLWRQPRDTLTGCLRAFPLLKTLKLGLKEVYVKMPAAPAWKPDIVESIRACLPKDCLLE
eukprot:TRINITY_DN83569_c0_g1_i1.p1 TRINITY_DN83569_c0_g1~~TRINITY_DN83569_c0_g1_i1.p1  ORF type:complete len:374 (-),score=74.60 TRINITY_DN83569_c0_g1_i1:74-1195(-)